jgi:hypothetical protein
MDVVYICRPGDNEELRYSIRSVVENLPHSNIWVVGSKPDWYSGRFINVPYFNDSSINNAKINLYMISDASEISEEYILMNDDFFIMEKIEKFDNYYQGTLLDKVRYYQELSPGSIYTDLLEITYKYLTETIGIEEPLNYEQHVPMKVTKTNMLDILPRRKLRRSLYGNIYNVGGECMDSDVKVYVTEPEKSFDFRNTPSKFLSCEDQSFPILLDEVLRERFPNKSIYESD